MNENLMEQTMIEGLMQSVLIAYLGMPVVLVGVGFLAYSALSAASKQAGEMKHSIFNETFFYAGIVLIIMTAVMLYEWLKYGIIPN
jgi:hypothetical protein